MKNKNYIAGIHNTCDRRCERCDSTDRCRVYDELKKAERRHKRRGEDPQDMDVALQDVRRSFERTRRLIARGAKKMGLDLDEIARQAALSPEVDGSRIDEHPLALEGMNYFRIGQELVKAVGADIDMTREDIGRRSRFMAVKGEAGGLAKVCQALDVLSWDISLVAVKIQRALSGLLGDGDEDSKADEFDVQDGRATAALVLSCLDRDKRALLAIYDWSKDHRDRALDLLAMNERMSRALRQWL